MTRYTGKRLESDVARFNQQLESANAPLRFVVGYRNNYTAVDLATPEQLEKHTVQRNLVCGSPRECFSATQAEYYALLLQTEKAKS